jgi:transposase
MAHSTKSYSDDLRERAVKSRLSGKSALEVARIFDVSKDCVRRWVIRYQETGSYSSAKRGGTKKSKIQDMDRFAEFVQANAYCTLKQMKEKWEDDVSEMALSRALKKLGITRKKSLPSTTNATRKSAKIF